MANLFTDPPCLRRPATGVIRFDDLPSDRGLNDQKGCTACWICGAPGNLPERHKCNEREILLAQVKRQKGRFLSENENCCCQDKVMVHIAQHKRHAYGSHLPDLPSRTSILSSSCCNFSFTAAKWSCNKKQEVYVGTSLYMFYLNTLPYYKIHQNTCLLLPHAPP